MGEENKVIGFYKDGNPIHENPSEEEISAHIDEWADLAQRLMNQEQREVIEEIRNCRINSAFVKLCQSKTDDQIIQLAIKVWSEQWPWEVKPFFHNVMVLRNGLSNDKAYGATDKEKSMVLYGQIPEKVKTLCLAVRRDFWNRDIKGKCKNMETFYQYCPKAKISSLRGSA